MKTILKLFSSLAVILFVIGVMPFAIAEYDENVGEVLQDNISFINYLDSSQNFSIDYPSFWAVHNSVDEFDADPGIDNGGLNLVSIDYQSTGTMSRINVYTLYDHIASDYDSQSYLDNLEKLVDDNCTNSESYFLYSCSNQKIIDVSTVSINDKTWHQITYTFDAVYSDDPSVFSHRNIISETIVDDDVWGVESTNYIVNDIKGNAMPPSAFEHSVNSFKFLDSLSTSKSAVATSDDIVSVSNFQVTDLSGNKLNKVIFGDQILLEVELTNNLDVTQEFVYNVTFENEHGLKNTHPSWIQGNLPGLYSFPASLSPIFQAPGNYTITVDIWNNNDEKTPIAPTTSYSLVIEADPNAIVDIEPLIVPEETKPIELTKGIASFVDSDEDPQHYVDRYNNEIAYKEWFDTNYSDYDSIYQAVGLEEPIPIPKSSNTPKTFSDPNQHHLLSIADGIQTYQNTTLNFSIDFPSLMLFNTISSSTEQLDGISGESVVRFHAYPPTSQIIIDNYFDKVNSIDDKQYLKNVEQRIIEFSDSVLMGTEPDEFTIISSKIIQIDGHKAYQVVAEAIIEDKNSENSHATKTMIITDIVNGNNILSITLVNFTIPDELITPEMTLFSPMFSNEQLTNSLNSIKFTTEKLSKKYVNSDLGLELIILDDWIMRDYSFVSNAGQLIQDASLDGYLHESFDHLISTVKIFPDSSTHLPGFDFLSVDIGTKDDLFKIQSPSDFLTSYQNHHHELMNKLGSPDCNLLLPESVKINNLESLQSGIHCNDFDVDHVIAINYILFLTNDHFIIMSFTERDSQDQPKYLDDVNTMIQSIKISKSIPILDTLDESVSVHDSDGPSCGAGTELVDGFCQAITLDENTSEETSFIDNIFGFFKSLFN